MTLLRRFKYPGTGPLSSGYSGALRPEVARIFVMDNTAGGNSGIVGGPTFARRTTSAGPRRGFRLIWPMLSEAEADCVFREWVEVRLAGKPITYTPDDGSDPLTVILTQNIRRVRVSATMEEIEVVLEEQR